MMEKLLNQIKEYIDLKIKSYKLMAIEQLSTILSKVFSIIIVILLAGFAVVLLTVAFTMQLAEWINSTIWAFVIMGGVFAIVAVLFFVLRRSMFAGSMINTFSQLLFPANNDNDNDDNYE